VTLATDRSLRTPIERIADHIERLRAGAFDTRQLELRLPMAGANR
jgi:hypothetical protein